MGPVKVIDMLTRNEDWKMMIASCLLSGLPYNRASSMESINAKNPTDAVKLAPTVTRDSQIMAGEKTQIA